MKLIMCISITNLCFSESGDKLLSESLNTPIKIFDIKSDDVSVCDEYYLGGSAVYCVKYFDSDTRIICSSDVLQYWNIRYSKLRDIKYESQNHIIVTDLSWNLNGCFALER